MRHLDLFSGIGGFALAAQTVWGEEYENVGFCDNEPFSQAIIKKHWPSATMYGDIKQLTPPSADLITGGFPCQPFSSAGLRRGTQDDRHLWPEMLRVIRLSAPRWVIAENVSGLLTWDRGVVLDRVCLDLESAGYQVWPFVLPAASVGAYHLRYRVWIIAHASSKRDGGKPGQIRSQEQGSKRHKSRQLGGTNKIRPVADVSSKRRPGAFLQPDKKEQGGHQVGASNRWQEGWPAAVARLCSVAHGLPGGVARPRGWRNAALKGAGNAIVPQVAIQIMQAIQAVDPNL